jgi:hypothetical protein
MTGNEALLGSGEIYNHCEALYTRMSECLTKNVDLTDALKQKLEDNGELTKLRSQLRYQVFQCLHSRTENVGTSLSLESPKHECNSVIDELIGEYLKYNGHSQTLSAFVLESSIRGSSENDLKLIDNQMQDNRCAETETALPQIYRLIQKVSLNLKD